MVSVQEEEVKNIMTVECERLLIEMAGWTRISSGGTC